MEWNVFPDQKPELVFFKDKITGQPTMSAWFICLPKFGGAPVMLRMIERDGEFYVVDRCTCIVGEKAEDIIRIWFPIPPDENGKIF